jgi:hypothetical protein
VDQLKDSMTCPLCGKPVAESADAVRTTAFLTKRDPLWRSAGRQIHRSCFLVWDKREEFVRKFNIVMQRIHRMDPRGDITDVD